MRKYFKTEDIAMNIHNLPTFERLRFADRLVRAIDNEPVLRGMCWSVSSLLLFFCAVRE